MNDKTYISLLEQFIFSEGYTYAELMAFVVNQLNSTPQKRRVRKYQK